MTEKDVLTAAYLQKNHRFAELVNVLCFGGRPIVSPEDVQEADSAELEIRKTGRRTKTKKRYRDVIRRVACGVQFALICVEEQSYVDYAMPVRVMGYNASRYEQQLRTKKEEHRRKRDLKGDEYLSGIAKDDRFLPVITLVLYFGTHWDGARDLKDLLELEGMPPQLRELAGDYPIYVVEVGNCPYTETFQTDLRLVFGFCQYADDKEKLLDFVKKEREGLSNLAEDAYDLISAITNTKELNKIKEEKQREEEKKDMCKAIDDMLAQARQEGREAGEAIGRKAGEAIGRKAGEEMGRTAGIATGRAMGRTEGRVEGMNETIQTFVKDYQEEGLSKEAICQKLEKLFSIAPETAAKYFAD